ncbi:DnaB-like helicase C-terminal domain-containing protein, partial [Arthrospira platensis SPKY1]|nr:DnaB-like helicase C-terminal domain-containing protein [Arthrospira platensis SPKY1]
PMLSDLRESGAIEQDADIAMMLYRDEYYNKETEDKSILEVIVVKSRDGETGTVKLFWDGATQTIGELDYIRG